VLGAPDQLDAVGATAALVGLLAAAAAVVYLFRRARGTGRRVGPAAGAAALALAVAGGTLPLTVWRVAHDLDHTTALAPDEARGAGPIQAFLQPYLLDEAARALPPGATYAAVTGPGVPYATAAKAFPSLARDAFFPRLAVEDPRAAEWIVAWGVDPAEVAEVESARVVTPRSGVYPAVVLARVARDR
jgi:hypothetical protein